MIRICAKSLAIDGSIEILKKGTILDPTEELKGPIRLRIKRVK